MNYKSILFFLGIYSLFVSFFSIVNILYSIYFDFTLGLSAYFVTLIVSLVLGSTFYYVGHKHVKDINLIDQIFFITLSYFLIPLLLSIPYALSVYDIGILDSYFESVSGFTSTGFSIIESVKNIDDPLVLWRSSSQWLGGLIFILSTIGTIGSKQIRIKPAYLVPGGASGRNFYNNFNYNFIKILLIYSFSTFFIIFIFSFADLRLLDSVNLSFTIISAGGFIPTDNLSTIIYSNSHIFAISVALLFPILNFFLFFDIISRQFNFKIYKETIHLFILVFLLILFIYFLIIPNNGFLNIIFAVVSSVSTSGISTFSSRADLSLFFILLTIIGGSLISTSSGFKYIRFYILLKISYQEIYRLVKPKNIIEKNLFNVGSKIDDQDVNIAFLVFILFIISIFILSGILTLDSLTFENSFKLSILTLTNTVNSSLFSMENFIFFDLSIFTKISLIMFMIFAKVEIIAVLYLLKRFIFRG